MDKDNFSLNEFHHGILLKAGSKEEIYKYLGTAEGLTKWFMGSAEYFYDENKTRQRKEYIKTGDKFTWKWLEKKLSINGIVIEAADKSHVRFTFGSLFEVTMSLKNHDERILFTLKQEYAPGASHDDFGHINCCVCWAFFITNLKSVHEFGNDLRETISHDEFLINR